MCPLAILPLLLSASPQAPGGTAPEAETARLEEAVRQSPASAGAWKQLGLALAARRNLDSALPAFARACELAPGDEDACYYLARNLYTLGRYQEAREPFDKALRSAPPPLQAKVHRAAALNFIALTRPDDAERHFREALRLTGGPARAGEDPRIDYGAFLFRQGRAAEAFPLLDLAVRAHPGSARAHTELGKVLLHLGKPEAAAARLQKAVELDPGSSTARLLLGKTYLALGRAEEGQKQLRLGQQAWKRSYGSSTVK